MLMSCDPVPLSPLELKKEELFSAMSHSVEALLARMRSIAASRGLDWLEAQVCSSEPPLSLRLPLRGLGVLPGVLGLRSG